MRLRSVIAILLTAIPIVAFADSAVISLTSFPTASVADGRSTVTIKAEIRDTNGRLVPDGTRVVFTTDQGNFRDPIAETKNGIARAVLVAPSNPVVARVSANAITYQATADLDFEFVKDRSMLSSATEYIELVAPKDLMFSMDLQTLAASGAGRQAIMRYRDLEVRADDLQVNVGTLELRARQATVKLGRIQQDFSNLYMKLPARTGYGTTTYQTKESRLIPTGRFFALEQTPERETVGIREIYPGGVRAPTSPQAKGAFDFVEVSDSNQVVTAKKAIAYPYREIQFHKSELFVRGVKVLSVPLFQLPLGAGRRLVTDDILNVANNSLSINYPYYLSLKPGQTSLLRFRTGQIAGRGLSVNRGIFLDYELNWNRGTDQQGSFAVQGIGRNDWGITANHYMALNDTTSAQMQLDLPSHRSIYGSLDLNKQLKGYQLNFTANTTRAIAGTPYSGHQVMLNAQSDPLVFKGVPLRVTYGAIANHETLSSYDGDYTRDTVGLNARAFTPVLYLDKATSLSADLSVSKLFGSNTLSGLSYLATAGLSRKITPGAFVMLNYSYLEDGFSTSLAGRHMLSLRSSFNNGPFYLDARASKGLDVDRTNYYVDASWRLNNSLRLSYSYTYDRFLGRGFLDYNFVLGYRFGFREFGLTWSHRTHRFGIQYLGTSFN